MRAIEELLRKTIGLDPATVGTTSIQRIIRLRMKTLGLKQTEDYEHLLGTSHREWTELVEAVVVAETWFFRDRHPFAALVRLVLEEWLSAHPTRPVRLLSLPCSSGEEPYSMAIALVEAGVPVGRFPIDAIDISTHALARATKAVYGKNSFRGRDLVFRSRYFQQTKGGFALCPAIRNRVQFLCANLLGDDFPSDRGPYDFVFCRNLLIYFDRPTQRKAVERIRQLLAPSGVLFVGAAEQPLVIGQGFVSANLAMAFACRRTCQSPMLVGRGDSEIKLLKALPPSVRSGRMSRSQPSLGRDGKCGSIGSALSPLSGLDRARELADTGRLAEAAAVCEAHLKKNLMSAQAWYLLGLIRDAGGGADAADYYRKALYLDPCHHDSLRQMSLLAEKNGDLARARTFRSRAERAKNASAVNSD
jgi:chemotaxis protein methyltransferase WspC